MKRKQGLSMVEIIVVMFILGTLTAILLPVISKAKKSAKITQAASNLKQIAVAAQLYRADYDNGLPEKGAVPGCLPDYFTYYASPTSPADAFGVDKQLFFSPCGRHPETGSSPGLSDLTYYPSSIESEDWPSYYARNLDSSIFIVDKNCGDHSAPLHNNFYTQFQLGARIDGSVKRRRFAGRGLSLLSWEEKQ